MGLRHRLVENVKSRRGIIDDLAVHALLRFQSSKSFSKAAWACGIIGRNPVGTRQGQTFSLGARVESFAGCRQVDLEGFS